MISLVDIFGGGGGGGRQARGSDLRYNLELSLEDAVKGKEVRIRVPALRACDSCSGSGAKPGTQPKTCGGCGGRGQVRMQQGFFSVQQTCPQCRGAGEVISDPCRKCSGSGRVEESRTLSVKVPAGVDSGDQIRLAGEGESGPKGAPSGDLYVQINIKTHPIFKRDGDNLYCDLPVSFTTAALGGELEVPTLDGRATLKIPEGTQSERLFRLRRKGVKNVRSGATGDLFCRVSIETPVNLTPKQKELLGEFQKITSEGGHKHSPRSGKWTDRLKSFLDDLVT